ncbi:(d)CMP kinase [Pediococcus pentosaceus]|jgi:cytidylate kinase|uniref:(d)CMP kinase n=1 Tax=Pediococcus pentosaceus TaxID=1255 RepID=UPI0006D8AA74|nr:(d)CMP kinase [Pediococcus pentosaceus]ANI97833.1 cytidylate kinase [Pediococcus pentosaceus]ASC08353.1 UMP/CMP kinase [Pediococcus pentosaceus]KQB81645.1 cytidylate kinase [Pediococcus pentosaceus]MBF7112425.1 (d)CMP kinase [Pediococcus pentosaceus]MBY4581256.1 (d)CMP kinase [Pediococcus pentosaceus]
MNNKYQIAIDGPASAGKSTVAKIVAKDLQYVYCDTGAMYRVVTLKAIQNGIDLNDETKISEMLNDTDIRFELGEPVQKVFLDGNEVTEDIRQTNVTNSVSTIAAQKAVREVLTNWQRDLAKNGGIVMDGRDIGSAVLPNAEVKIFLIASVQERAERRYKENIAKGMETDLEQLKKEIEIRDHKDSTRKISPLTKASDAIEVDTTSMSIQDVVNEILRIVENASKRK